MDTHHQPAESGHEQGGSQGRRDGHIRKSGVGGQTVNSPPAGGEGCDFKDLLAATHVVTGIVNVFGVGGLLILHVACLPMETWKLPLTDSQVASCTQTNMHLWTQRTKPLATLT